MSSSGLLGAGVLVARGVAAGSLFLDDATLPVLNVQHQAPGGAINLSAGPNPGQSFYVLPQVAGNTQVFSGPSAVFSNSLQVPGTTTLGVANVSNALNVTGNTTLTGSLYTSGSTIIGNTLQVGQVVQVGNTTNTPIVRANLVTTSALSATGPLANAYLETFSNSSSTTAALYLSSNWRLKAISTGALAFQSILNGQWTNASIIAPAGASATIGQLTSSST